MKKTGRLVFSCYNEEADDMDYMSNQVFVYDFFLDGVVGFSLCGDCAGEPVCDDFTEDGEMVMEYEKEEYDEIAKLVHDMFGFRVREQRKRELVISCLRDGSDEQKDAVLDYLRSKADFCRDIEHCSAGHLAFVLEGLLEHFKLLVKKLGGEENA